jgi:signal transduction histidine kinase
MTETHSPDARAGDMFMDAGTVTGSTADRTRVWHPAREHTQRYARVSTALVTALTARAVAQVIAREASLAVNSRSVAFGLLCEGGTVFEVAVHTGVTAEVAARWQRFANQGALPFPHVARTGEALFLCDRGAFTTMFPSLAEDYAANGFHASAILPLIANGRLLGALSLEFTEPNPFPDDEREFLFALASQTALALDRARLAESEQQARQTAEQATRATSNFLAVVSHELRTPLNTLSGYTDLMLAGVHGPLPDRYTGYVERMRSAQKYLAGLVDNVLRYARIEAGQISYTMATHSAVHLLCTLESLVEPQASARQLQLAVEAASETQQFRADDEKVLQILLNLVSNAIKYSPAGSTITVRAARVGPAIEISVQDQGCGIQADQLERIFEPFVQLDPGQEPHGAGLGLAISRDLARAMGGDITVTSAVGQGACFVLRLPAA